MMKFGFTEGKFRFFAMDGLAHDVWKGLDKWEGPSAWSALFPVARPARRGARIPLGILGRWSADGWSGTPLPTRYLLEINRNNRILRKNYYL